MIPTYRYCQRCSAEYRTSEYDYGRPNPCLVCGGSQFDSSKPSRIKLNQDRHMLTESDRIFLRVQGISPSGL